MWAGGGGLVPLGLGALSFMAAGAACGRDSNQLWARACPQAIPNVGHEPSAPEATKRPASSRGYRCVRIHVCLCTCV